MLMGRVGVGLVDLVQVLGVLVVRLASICVLVQVVVVVRVGVGMGMGIPMMVGRLDAGGRLAVGGVVLLLLLVEVGLVGTGGGCWTCCEGCGKALLRVLVVEGAQSVAVVVEEAKGGVRLLVLLLVLQQLVLVAVVLLLAVEQRVRLLPGRLLLLHGRPLGLVATIVIIVIVIVAAAAQTLRLQLRLQRRGGTLEGASWGHRGGGGRPEGGQLLAGGLGRRDGRAGGRQRGGGRGH